MACCIALSDDAYMHMQLSYNRLIKKQASIEQTGVVFSWKQDACPGFAGLF